MGKSQKFKSYPTSKSKPKKYFKALTV
jgi:hypothetical protein